MPSDSQRPNILLIMTDQHHAACVGYNGHPDVTTPNVDRLAAEGVVFRNCFVQNGVCTPSRVSYLTGLYPHTNGCTENNLPLSKNRPCFPEMVSTGKYATGYFW